MTSGRFRILGVQGLRNCVGAEVIIGQVDFSFRAYLSFSYVRTRLPRLVFRACHPDQVAMLWQVFLLRTAHGKNMESPAVDSTIFRDPPMGINRESIRPTNPYNTFSKTVQASTPSRAFKFQNFTKPVGPVSPFSPTKIVRVA